MSESTPIPLQPDKSFDSAVQEAQRDYARLLHAHSPSWSINLSGSVVWRCGCSDSTARNAAAMDSHILTAVRNARGPVRRAR